MQILSNASRHHKEALFTTAGVPVSLPKTAESLAVLTRDAGLLQTLRAVVTDRSLSSFPSEAELAVHLLSDHGAVALIDAGAVASPLAEFTSRLKAQFPDLVLVVAGGSQEQADLTALIGSGTVYRFLHKPLSEQRLKLFVDAAWRRHGEELAGIVGLAQTQAVLAVESQRSRKALWLSLAAVGATIVIALLTLMNRRPAPEAPLVSRAPAAKSVPVPAPSFTAPPRPIADQAPREPLPETIVSVRASSVQMARAPNASAPAGSETTAKQQQLIERLVIEARKAFSANDADEGERWAQAARDAGATEEDLDWLQRETERVRLALRAQSITQVSERFNDRLARGKLVQPLNDSAKLHLAQLKQIDPDHPATRLAEEAYADRLLAEARTFVAKQDFAAARRWLVEAHEAGADPGRIMGVESEIAMAQVAPVASAEAAIDGSLQKIQHVDPEFPIEAAKAGTDGWVDLDLTVQADGSVSQVVVRGAQPTGLFEQAAVAAARKWRYARAATGAGATGERRTKVRIRFELKMSR